MTRWKKLITLIICILTILCLISEYDNISKSVLSSLILWVKTLIPSLFPYIILSEYLVFSGSLELLNPAKRIISKILNLSKNGAEVYITSLISGYPCPAICTNEMLHDGVIDKEEAERLVLFTNNASPLFLISAVGTGMLLNLKDGVVIYLIQFFSSLISGIIIGFGKKRCDWDKRCYLKTKKPLTKCCESAVNTMLKICAYIVMTAIIGSIFISLFEKLPFLKSFNAEFIKGFTYCFLEISSGVKYLSGLGNTPIIFSLICAVCSWAGLSVILQIKGVLWEDFPIKKLIFAKAFQSIISFRMGYIYKTFEDYTFYSTTSYALDLSLFLAVILFIFFICAKKKTYHF